MSLEHKSSHKLHRYICSNSQQYIQWVKIIFILCQKSLSSCSMKIFCKCPTIKINIFLLIWINFWMVICIAKNLIWTTLKMIFSIFRCFCTLRFQIFKDCPIITNHTSMDRLFIILMYKISISSNWPVWLVLSSGVTSVCMMSVL